MQLDTHPALLLARNNGMRPGHCISSTVLGRCLLAMLLVIITTTASARTVPVLTYHNFPPFVVDAKTRQGLSFDIVNILNALKLPGIEFKLAIHPRARLNRELRRQPEWLVLWANPAWFKDRDMITYAWSAPVFEDANVLVTRDPDFDYSGPLSLQSMQMLGLREHSYQGIDEMIESGMISREDAPGWDSLLLMVAYRPHVDFTILPMLAARYYRTRLQLQDEVFISPTPHSRFTRSIMGPSSSATLKPLIDTLAEKLAASPQWKALIKHYQLDELYIDDPEHYSGKSWYFSLDPKDRAED
ncbi:hypothetical protein ACTXGQ_17230 [Marinobacter sp. 1Y8]